MPRESKKARKQRAAEVVARLRREYPEAHCALVHRNPYELLAATILSAQCTDERVNQVTPALFERYPAAVDLAGAEQGEVESLIRPTGFFRNKAKSLLGMATSVVELHDGEIPRTMDELKALPGVGRKTANVVLGNAFDENVGVVVDTHVRRVSQRLAFTSHEDPEKIEEDLMALIPQDEWTHFSHLLISHGRSICVARKPRCDICPLNDTCPSSRV